MPRIWPSTTAWHRQLPIPPDSFSKMMGPVKAKVPPKTKTDRAPALYQDRQPPIDMGLIHHQLGILQSLTPPAALQRENVGYYVSPNGRIWTNRKCYELGEYLLQFDGGLSSLSGLGFLSLVFHPGPDGRAEVFVTSPGHPYDKLYLAPQNVFDAAHRALVEVNQHAAHGDWRAGTPIPDPGLYAKAVVQQRR
jgi:hypothetical protein